jgi:hypothetical protein
MRKRLYHIVFLFGCLLTLLGSCQKELDIYVPDSNFSTGPDTVWYNSISAWMPVSTLKQQLRTAPVEEQFQILQGPTSHIFSNGMEIQIPAGAISDSLGQPYFGMLKATAHLLSGRGDFIRNGVELSADDRYLTGAGAFYIGLQTPSGLPLTISGGSSLQLQYPIGSGVSGSYPFYRGDSVNLEIIWTPVQDTLYNGAVVNGNRILIQTNQKGWLSPARSVIQTAPPTRIAIQLPSNYTNANTVAYAFFEDQISAIRLQADPATRMFKTNELPVGKNLKLVVLSKQANSYFIGSTQVVTSTPTMGSHQLVQMTPVISSLPLILNQLSTL